MYWLACSAFFELLWTITTLWFFFIEKNYLIPNAFSFHPNCIKVDFLWYQVFMCLWVYCSLPFFWQCTCSFWAGVHVACGNASKSFHPFLLPGDFKGSLEDLRNKVLVNFDPLRCFIGDLEASIYNALIYLFVFFIWNYQYLYLVNSVFALIHFSSI